MNIHLPGHFHVSLLAQTLLERSHCCQGSREHWNEASGLVLLIINSIYLILSQRVNHQIQCHHASFDLLPCSTQLRPPCDWRTFSCTFCLLAFHLKLVHLTSHPSSSNAALYLLFSFIKTESSIATTNYLYQTGVQVQILSCMIL